MELSATDASIELMEDGTFSLGIFQQWTGFRTFSEASDFQRQMLDDEVRGEVITFAPDRIRAVDNFTPDP